ncbi:serine protease inhibitor Kazal-type 4-like [Aricia agestis]|uniref:serine protease inhibitor Kazal-type 4-like n=1 Tax=Aricia agestis TaxID=91739 RepID=UPI001C207769|nr:serine protease inhibitor Kazal-type 4-like [Aricia agestis]
MENGDVDKITLVLLIATIAFCQDNRIMSKNEAQHIQENYMERVTDSLPLLELITDCEECPRAYLPVCGTDNRTYSNLCWLNCVRTRFQKVVFHAYDGHCHQFVMPFDY